MRFLSSHRGGETPGELLRRKYASFRRLLATNNEILELIADLEGALTTDEPIDPEELRAIAASTRERVLLMVEDLNVVAEARYRSLRGVVERVGIGIDEALRTVQGTPVTAACLPIEEVDRSLADAVGGKTANLGEVHNQVGLPVPAGFAITAFAYRSFVSGLQPTLTETWNRIDWDDAASLREAADRMQQAILVAELPQDVRESITLASHDLYRQASGRRRVSLRSSAIGEDSRTSFAGQYASYLNVPLEQILRRYKEVVASKFGSAALFYMHSHGLREEQIAMSVGCFLMVDARAAGVAYTVDPNDPDFEQMMIAAVWGLGKTVVDGTVTPDTYFVPRRPEGGEVHLRIVPKTRRVVCAPSEGVVDEPVPNELVERACLTDTQLERLAGYLRALEAHYRAPQDVEWALDHEGRLFVLQTRPLALPEDAARRLEARPATLAPVLLSGGATACPGVGCGIVVRAESDDELARFPDGAVLVARTSSPRLVKAMTKAAAIVTDLGSVTGHMASLAREYGVPTICSADRATQLPPGVEVTVDATRCTVLKGRVEELLVRGHRRSVARAHLTSMAVQERVTARIARLNLTDPSKNSFRAKSCRTYHDVVRFCHEMAISEMFHINDYTNLRERGMAFRLETEVPLGLYLIDLGDGIDVVPGSRSIRAESIRSVPMRALWRGITTPGVRWSGARPIDVGGFLSVMASTMVDASRGERELGDSSYAMLGGSYVNFGSRLGYHFTTLESVCSDSIHENYIIFRFKGGAADIDRRERRVRFISAVLEHAGFDVDRRRDLLNAWVRKLPREATEEGLEMLGRLMGCARQLDVIMHAETTVQHCVDAFLNGQYGFFDFNAADPGLRIE